MRFGWLLICQASMAKPEPIWRLRQACHNCDIVLRIRPSPDSRVYQEDLQSAVQPH